MGGGEVELWHFVGDDSGVFFFTFRGILGSSEGYLFMNSDTVPSGGETMQVEKIAPRWFFVQTE